MLIYLCIIIGGIANEIESVFDSNIKKGIRQLEGALSIK